MINSRSLDDLAIEARAVASEHVRLCQEAGVELIVTSTYRDFEAQDALFAIGRTMHVDRKPVTKAKGGKSWHNYACAWDVVPVVGGKAQWNSPVWSEVIAIAKSLGAEAGAEWKSFPDRPHFQVRPVIESKPITIAQAFERFTMRGTIFEA